MMHGPAKPNTLPNHASAERDEAEALASQAARCRRLAAAISDREASELLSLMAESYERNAAALRRQF